MCRNLPPVGFFFSPQGKKGDMIGNRYKVLGDVGLGTFGRVVECWDMKRRRQVAVKVVRKVHTAKNTAALSKRPVRLLHCAHTQQTLSTSRRSTLDERNQPGESMPCFSLRTSREASFVVAAHGRNPRDVDAPPFVRTRAVR